MRMHSISINVYVRIEELSMFQNQRKIFMKRINWTTSEDVKISPLERCIRTLEGKLFWFIFHSKSESYHDKLDNIVESYNFSPHLGLFGLTPVDAHLLVTRQEIDFLLNKINNRHLRKRKSVVLKLSLGRVVLITSARKTFARGFHQKATAEIFKIKSIDEKFYPTTY